MNDELQKALAAILTKTTQAVEAGVSFLSQQLPEVIQQLLMWHAVRSAVFFFVFAVVLAVVISYSRKLFKDKYGPHPLLLVTVPIAVLAFVFLINELAWLQIIIAPKVYLIEYAAKLAK